MDQPNNAGVQKDKSVKEGGSAALRHKSLPNLFVRLLARAAHKYSARKSYLNPGPGDDAVKGTRADLDSYQGAVWPVYSMFALDPAPAKSFPGLSTAPATP